MSHYQSLLGFFATACWMVAEKRKNVAATTIKAKKKLLHFLLSAIGAISWDPLQFPATASW